MPSSALAIPLLVLLSLLIPATPTGPAVPDEGMWTFDNVPRKILKEKYGFEPSAPWLEHVRLSSVRVSTGGSGSFVSPHGLVMTNHHVALELVSKLSSVQTDFVKTGFLAKTNEEELKCPGAELRQLVSMTDVTADVEKAAADADESGGSRSARGKAMSRIASEMKSSTGLTVDIVTLYGGGQYVAYAYKIYNDVRLVFVPEMRVAYFGGDYDNFVYPRYCLDVAFLRAYEDGKPANTAAHYFKWSAAGAADGELVFVTGHPGDTGRLLPFARIKYERDVYNPVIIDFLRGQEKTLVAFSARGEAERLQVLDDLFGVRNSLKAFEGQQTGLLDPEIMARKEAEDAAFRKAAANDPEATQAFAKIEECTKVRSESFPVLMGMRLDGDLVRLASGLARLADGLQKPEEDRPARLKGDELAKAVENLAKPVEVDVDRQRETFEGIFTVAAKHLGPTHPFVKLAIGQDDPAAAARKLVATTKVGDAAFRKAIAEPEGAKNVLADPLVKIVREAESLRRTAQANYQKAEAAEAQAMTVLAKARFRVYGKDSYPDATFTLRLSFGKVQGYELGTTLVPYKTTFYGLYARNAEMDGKEPFDLPERWLKAREKLDLNTPYDFVSTCDIIGGNSGSPVINKDAEVVGLIFDGNIQSLPGRYIFDERQNRAVSVHSRAITHALERVYEATTLLGEINGK